MNIGIIIPTLNAGAGFTDLLAGVARQRCNFVQKLIIDSGSGDATIPIAQRYGWEVIKIARATFNHGGTRGQAFNHIAAGCDIAIFLTQDVVLYDHTSLVELIKPFSDAKIGAVYGRQLPFAAASPLAKQARLFNYPAISSVKAYADKEKYGIKTAFCSDSFAAYRTHALKAVGGFPERVIVAEDMYNAAKLLLVGYNIAYASDAKVYHSHDYNLAAEFRRYFDTGVFHGKEAWLGQAFGKAEGEGIKLVKHQLNYLYQQQAYYQIPIAIIGDAIKLLAYRLGLGERYLPVRLKKLFSGQPYYFVKQGEDIQ